MIPNNCFQILSSCHGSTTKHAEAIKLRESAIEFTFIALCDMEFVDNVSGILRQVFALKEIFNKAVEIYSVEDAPQE